jgi:exopolysaccharide production negative regulator
MLPTLLRIWCRPFCLCALLALGGPLLHAQEATKESPAPEPQAPAVVPPAVAPPAVVPPALGGSSVVPRTNSRVVGETPSPADAWWKLGRMYAERGDDARAFGIFLQLVDSYRDNPGSVPPVVAADSHVQLGLYYLKGIPGTLPSDRDVAHRLLEYAASFFGDAEAQYELGRLLLAGPRKNVVQAARWLQAAAKKNHRSAQALLGSVLLRGEGIARQPGLGLFWLMLANDGEDPPEPWIKDLYASALALATEKDRVAAYKHLEEWLSR